MAPKFVVQFEVLSISLNVYKLYESYLFRCQHTVEQHISVAQLLRILKTSLQDPLLTTNLTQHMLGKV